MSYKPQEGAREVPECLKMIWYPVEGLFVQADGGGDACDGFVTVAGTYLLTYLHVREVCKSDGFIVPRKSQRGFLLDDPVVLSDCCVK